MKYYHKVGTKTDDAEDKQQRILRAAGEILHHIGSDLLL